MIGKLVSEYWSQSRELATRLEGLVEKIDVHESWKGTSSGVDGGLVVKKYTGFDLIFYRALGVFFGSQVEYFPERFPGLKVRINDVGNSSKWGGILRQAEEVRTMINVIEKFQPDVPILDGSIKPHPSLKTDRFIDDYNEMMSLFSRMWKMRAVGVIKDPRSSSLIKTLIGIEWRDSSVINEFLGENQRTNVFSSDRIKFFYLKIKNDFPVKIEFTKGDPDEIASAIVSLSRGYQNLPLPVLEADFSVKIKENDIKAYESRYIPDPGMKRRRDRAQ